MQVDLQVEVPKGYELTGEYRIPKEGESFLNSWGKAEMQVGKFIDFSRLILRKVDTWRDATLDDLKRVMDGETVECRYRNFECGQWRYGYVLRGWNTSETDMPVWNMQKNGVGEFVYTREVQVKE
jgi:hypothetical protein